MRCVRKMVRSARLPLWPACSVTLLIVLSSGTIQSVATAAPRSQSLDGVLRVSPPSTESQPAAEPSPYLTVIGPSGLNLVAPVVVKEAPPPVYPASEELARNPEAYAARQAERRSGETGGVTPEDSEGLTLTVGGELLPEVTVSPYSRARVRPEEVILFFKDEKLDGLRGGIAYPAARLRFDPARPEVRASSSATYTSQ